MNSDIIHFILRLCRFSFIQVIVIHRLKVSQLDLDAFERTLPKRVKPSMSNWKKTYLNRRGGLRHNLSATYNTVLSRTSPQMSQGSLTLIIMNSKLHLGGSMTLTLLGQATMSRCPQKLTWHWERQLLLHLNNPLNHYNGPLVGFTDPTTQTLDNCGSQSYIRPRLPTSHSHQKKSIRQKVKHPLKLN